jgi:hypothetical protein
MEKGTLGQTEITFRNIKKFSSFSEAIKGISTPKGRAEAKKITEVAGTGGTFRAELASREGDVEKTAAFLAVANEGNSGGPWVEGIYYKSPVEIFADAYRTKSRMLESEAEKQTDPSDTARLRKLAKIYKDQSETMLWHER